MRFIRKNQIIAAVCLLLALAFSSAFAQTAPTPPTPEEKAQLQQQLDQIESQIMQYQQELKQIAGQKNTLQNKINQLKKQQASLNLQIQATNLQLDAINSSMVSTQATIDANVAQSGKLKDQLSGYIRLLHEQDNDSLLYILLSQDNLSDVLNELENSSQISQSLNKILNEIEDNNNQLQQRQDTLSQQKDENDNLLSIQSLQKQQLVASTSEQATLLTQTKGQESNYQAVLSDSQKQAAAIRSRLYPLLDVNNQISFGQAVEIAQYAQGLTGVRTAFLLAILTQESNLGKNVGTCNRPGDPPEKGYQVIMKPDRDIPPFLQITADLGMDPKTTPVSCPLKNKNGSQNGWGGAMGPAQFIPSTWMGYKNQVTALSGKMANPWDIRDAFVAAAIKLKAGGAGTQDGEWAAAMRYFSGGTNVKYRFYGDNVVATAAKYQQDIDALGK
ncbi:MAG: hypothetical protein WDN47_05510 [Candidatus Doudnabacteria bacterium]